ncbi:MAG: hypothetical protein ACE5FU_03050 [Nitrospinota bacterium]
MKILVTRTAPFTVFKKALTKIRSVHPGAALYVLIQKSSRQSLASYGGGITPITISDGPFSLLENGPSLVNKIRAEKFDLAVVLYGNERGTGYLNVSLLTLLGDVPSEMIFDNLENFYVNRYRLFKILRKFVQSSFGHFLYSTILMVLKFSKFFHTCQTESTVWKKNEQKTADFPVFPQKKAKRIVMVDLMFTWPLMGVHVSISRRLRPVSKVAGTISGW